MFPVLPTFAVEGSHLHHVLLKLLFRNYQRMSDLRGIVSVKSANYLKLLATEWWKFRLWGALQHNDATFVYMFSKCIFTKLKDSNNMIYSLCKGTPDGQGRAQQDMVALQEDQVPHSQYSFLWQAVAEQCEEPLHREHVCKWRLVTWPCMSDGW